MIVLLFVGYSGHGKTTAAQYVYEQCLKYGKTLLLGFGDFVKDEVAEKYNIPRTLCDTQDGKRAIVHSSLGPKSVREYLIHHSFEQKQKYGQDYYAKKVIEKIETESPLVVILHDLRFPTELATLQSLYTNIYTIRILNPHAPISSAESEHQMDTYKANITIHNDTSLENLYNSLDYIFRMYISSPLLAASLSVTRNRSNIGFSTISLGMA